MANSGFDGSIRIDTSVDTRGMNKGTKDISRSLDGLLRSIKAIGRALVAAFVGGTIINAIRQIIGGFDFMNSSIAGNLKPLSDALTTLKGTFINLIATALIPLVPYIVIVVQWLTNLLNIIAQVVAALFGMQQTVGSISKDAKKTAKETKGALASFDQINVLQKNKPEDEQENQFITPPPIQVSQEIIDTVDRIKAKFFELWEMIKKGAIDAWVWFMRIWTPVSSWVNEHIIKPLSAWIKENPEKFKMFAIIIGLVILAFIILAAVIANWALITAIAGGVASLFAVAMGILFSPIGLVILAILILINVIAILVVSWFLVKDAAEDAWTLIKALWIGAAIWFKFNVIDKIQSSFFSMLDSLKEKFRTVFETVKKIIVSIVNGIIGIVDNMIGAIINGINLVLAGVNAVGALSGVPAIPLIPVPSLPKLATGAVIPPNAEFAAILGDQKSGRNIETPEKLLRDIMDEKLGKMSADIKIEFTGSLAEVARVLNPVLKKENVRIGTNLVKETSKSI
jgi:hypothetical protein